MCKDMGKRNRKIVQSNVIGSSKYQKSDPNQNFTFYAAYMKVHRTQNIVAYILERVLCIFVNFPKKLLNIIIS